MSEEIKNEQQTNIDETIPTDESLNTEESKETNVDTKIPYERFKAKVDEANALKEKLAAIEKAQEEAKRKELEQQNEYKTLYEQAQEQLAQFKADALNAKKDAMLAKAGYTDEQIAVLRGTVSGETDEEIANAIEGLKSVITPKPTYVDPSPMNGERGKPEQTDDSDIGRNLFERLKAKGKIK